MSRIIAIHSFRGGTGKSNTTAGLCTLMALQGYRVGVIDTDIQSPGIHILFGLDEHTIHYTLNDYLWGHCEIHQTAYDVTDRIRPDEAGTPGRIYLIPSSFKAGEIARVLREGVDVAMLHDGFQQLVAAYRLDALLIDTHPGLHEETILSVAISDVLVILLRPDQQDYQGTGVTMEVARRLGVPRILMIVNKVPPAFDLDAIRREVAATYDCEVAAALPHADEMMLLASTGLFALQYPDHPITHAYRRVARRLLA